MTAAAASDLAFAGAARQAALVRSGEVSSRELVELYLERIERIDPELNAYRVVMAESALAEADAADRRRQAGEERPLLGVPFAIKDNVDVAGQLTTRGTRAHGPAATSDAEVVRRLREAGAVILGKTNVPELEIMGSTESPTWGVTRNPWGLEHTPGGSSGGSGAAVAAGLAAAAHATDGAGSIRIPAANCGLFGLKPQRGRVSLMPNLEHWKGMSVSGVLSRTVEDTALYLDAVSGAVPGDLHAAEPPSRPFVESARTPPGRLRIAVSFRPPIPVPVHPEVRRVVAEMEELLRSLGHEVERLEPAYNEIGTVFMPRYLRGIADDASDMARPELLQRRTRGIARLGRALPDAVVERAIEDEGRQAARINRIFDSHDLLVTPTTAQPPPGAAEWEGLGGVRTLLGMIRVYPYLATWNATGQPAASVPAGFTGDGLPLGVQVVARPHDEETLLSLAGQLEAERPWAEARPPVS